MIKLITAAAVFMNVLSFALMGIDKMLARKGARRISEKTLMLSALLLGALGAYIGMYLFRHKTRHIKFTVGLPLLIILNTVIIIAASSFA